MLWRKIPRESEGRKAKHIRTKDVFNALLHIIVTLRNITQIETLVFVVFRATTKVIIVRKPCMDQRDDIDRNKATYQ